MGNWNISIRGVGPHHNGQPYDAEQVAARAVEELRAAGHTVVSAEVTYGGVVVLSDGQYGGVSALLPLASAAKSFLVGLLALLVLAPAVAWAQPAAAPPIQDDLGSLAELLLQALTGRNWPLLASLAIVLLVALVRRLGSAVPLLEPVLAHPVVAWLLPTLAAVGATLIAALQSGTPISLSLMLNALVTALAANGLFNGSKKLAEARAVSP